MKNVLARIPKKKQLFLLFSGILVIASLLTVHINDAHLLHKEKIMFNSSNDIELSGTYYPGSLPVGMMFLTGFGSDQIMMKNMISEFADWDIHCFTFDFSGHGRSKGTIGFDNAQTDVLANQVITAKQQFMELSGLEGDQIYMIGHSMGARVAIQATLLDSVPSPALVLLGPSINLSPNTQADFFTGVDDTSLEWIQSLNHSNPASDILIISGQWDDVIPPTQAEQLLDHLTVGSSIYARELVIIPALFHNYEIFSARALNRAQSWLAPKMGLENQVNTSASHTIIRLVGWAIFILSFTIFLLQASTLPYIETKVPSSENHTNQEESVFNITDPRKFLITKAWLWLLALPVLGLLGGLFFILPLGLPVFNIIYVGFISSYGIISLIIYRLGKAPGTRGKFRIKSLFSKPVASQTLTVGLSIFVVILICLTFFLRSGWWYIYPINDRLWWLFIFGLLSTLGYGIGQLEFTKLTKNNHFKPHYQQLLNLLNFFPFYLLILLYIGLRSYSGLLGSIQGLVVLVWVHLMGKTLSSQQLNAWVIALCQGFLLQFVLLPQTPLFAF